MGSPAQLRFEDLLVEPLRNGIYKPKQYHGRGASIVNMGELFANPRLGRVPMRRLDVNDRELDRFGVRAGDLLFARRSLVAEGAGKCCLVTDADAATVFESSIIRARPNPGQADSAYLFYFFASPLGIHLLDTIRRHVAVAGITGSDLARLEIPLPGLRAQSRIAEILGALDDKIELNRRMSETLEATARALFKSWFVDLDNPGAWRQDTWGAGTLADVADLNPEAWPSRGRPSVLRYVELSGTKWGRIDVVTNYEAPDAPSRAQRVLRSGDTIIGTVRPGNGSYAMVAREGLTGSTGFAQLRPRSPRDAAFVYLASTGRDNIEALAHAADGGAYPAIRPALVVATPVVLADPQTLDAFSAAASPLLERAARAEDEAGTLAAMRDTLLPRLISGGLRIEDAEGVVAAVSA